MLEALKAWGIGILVIWIIGATVFVVWRHWWVIGDVLYPVALGAFCVRFTGALVLDIYRTRKCKWREAEERWRNGEIKA